MTKRVDHFFFSGMALLCLAVIVLGFGRSYFFSGMVAAPLSGGALVHIHAGVMTAWAALQVIQPGLIAARRVRWHRQLGNTGKALAVAVPVVGALVAIGEVRRHKWSVDVLAGDFTGAIVATVDFAVLAYLGLRQRATDLSAHKRLMLLATIAILGPAIGRLAWVKSDTVYLLVFAFVVALPIAFDGLSLRRIHRATMLGAAIIAVSQVFSVVFSYTEPAQQIVLWLQGV